MTDKFKLPYQKGEAKETKRRKEVLIRVQKTVDIIVESGLKDSANYLITSAAATQIINQLKEEGEL